jgi:dolichyl-phosphate-mannose-protein mannosyltransferase
MQIFLLTNSKKFLILIPLVLSGFVHLWNPSGFPDMFYDEGIYIRRAMHVIAGLGPQEGTFYDHPYFGQLFLAGIFTLIDYPSSLDPQANPQSISSLLAVPRLIMGMLAIVDTFLIYKITRLRYGSNVALFAAILFVVMPFTWLTRRILLDSILLPFLLSSILLAYYANQKTRGRWASSLLIFASGTMLGISIFTKIPAFAAIPLVAYLIIQSPIRDDGGRNKQGNEIKWKVTRLGLWLIPVIIIPMIWPIHTASTGQFDSWLKDVIGQSKLKNDVISAMWVPFAKVDPVLLILGAAGLVHAGLKKDYFLLLWFLPFAIFFSIAGYHQYFYVLPVAPVLCIALSKLIFDRMVKRFENKKEVISTQLISWLPPIALVVFGLTTTVVLINTNMTSAQFQAVAFGINYAIAHKDTALAASPAYSWIFPYAFHISNTLKDYGDIRYFDVDTNYILLFIDVHLKSDFDEDKLKKIYDTTDSITDFKGNLLQYDQWIYPFTNMEFNREGGVIEARIGSALALSPKGIFK